jgi:hypothetical protein
MSSQHQNAERTSSLLPARAIESLAVQRLQNSGVIIKEDEMPRGDKSKYTDKEKRQEEHIEEGYESRGVPKEEAERRGWATVNKIHGGGEKPGGSGYGQGENHESMRKGGRNSHKNS